MVNPYIVSMGMSVVENHAPSLMSGVLSLSEMPVIARMASEHL